MIDTLLPLPIDPTAEIQKLTILLITRRQPVRGTITVTVLASADAQTDSSTASLTLDDTEGPRLLGGLPSELSIGPTLNIGIHAEDNAGLAKIYIDWSGVVTRSDTITVFSYRRSWSGTIPIELPESVGHGDTVAMRTRIVDMFGYTFDTTRVARILDRGVPTIALTEDSLTPGIGLVQPRIIAVGDTAFVTVEFRDNYHLAGWGIDWGGIRESTEVVGDTLVTIPMALTVPPMHPDSGVWRLWFFTWDSVGYRAETRYRLSFFNAKRRPMTELGEFSVRTGALTVMDGEARRVYTWDVTARRIRVFDLASGGQVAWVGVPFELGAMDLTASDDSLIVVAKDRTLWVVAINGSELSVSEFSLSRFISFDFRSLVVSAENRVLLTGDGLTGGVTAYEINLNTMEHGPIDLGVDVYAGLKRTADRRRVVLTDNQRTVLFDMIGDSTIATRQTGYTSRFVMTNADGTMFVFASGDGFGIFDDAFAPIFDPFHSPEVIVGISGDAQQVYTRRNYPEILIRSLIDGLLQERIMAPGHPSFILRHPDGDRLLLDFEGRLVFAMPLN